MADRVIAIQMTMDAGQTVSETEKVEKNLQGVDQSLEQIDETSKQLTLDERLAAINKEVESGDLGFRQLRKKIQDYQTIAIAAGRDSPIGKEALQQAAQLRDQLDDLDKEVKNLATDGQALQGAMQLGQGVVAGFTAFKGVTAALGVENEALMETMTQLQGLQSAMMGIERLHTLLRKESTLVTIAHSLATKGMAVDTERSTAAQIRQGIALKVLAVAQKAYNIVVGQSTGLMKAFRVALIGTGIGAIVLLIVALVTNFEALSKWVSDLIEKFGVFGKILEFIVNPLGAINRLLSEQQEATAALSAEQKALAEEQARANQARLDQIEKEKNEFIEAKDEQIKALELEMDTLLAEGKRAEEVNLLILEGERDKLVAVREANAKKIQSWVDYYNNLAELRGEDEEEFKQSMLNQGIDLDSLQEKANKLLEENDVAIQFAENKVTKFRREQNEKRAQDAEKTHQRELKSVLASIDREIAIRKAKGQETTDLEREKLQTILDATEENTEKRKKALNDLAVFEINLIRKVQQENQKAADELFKSRQTLADRLAKFEAERGKDELQIRLDELRARFEAERELIKENHELVEQLEREFADNMAALDAEIRAADDEIAEAEKAKTEAEFQERLATAEGHLATAQAILGAVQEINNLINMLGERRMEENNKRRDAELKDIDAQKKKELSAEGLTARQKAIIEKKFAEQEFKVKLETAKKNDEIALKQFKREKALKIAMAAINTAAAVMQALGSSPPPLSFVMAGIAATMGAVQIAMIAATKFKSEASNIQPPNISIPNVPSDTGGTGGGGDAGAGGGGIQDDTTTDLEDLANQKPTVSITQVQDVDKTVTQMDDIATIN